MILDVFSRCVVGWMVAPHESAALAERRITATCTKQGIEPGQLTRHADRRASMRSKPVALLLADLGVVKTHSGPSCRMTTHSRKPTLKYRPTCPERFGALDARAFGQGFFPWDNHAHHHSALGYLTPATVHDGLGEGVRDQRQQVLAAAYAAHPERFVRGVPQPAPLPQGGLDQPASENTGTRGSPRNHDRDSGRPAGPADSSAPVPVSIKEVVL